MSLNEIYVLFKESKSWEERHRLLIQFSRQLTKPSEEELAILPEIHGCESRLWFNFSLEPRKISAYSDARLMQGILAILSIALSEKTVEQLQQFDIQALFDELQLSRHLTSTRLNGLKQIQQIVQTTANR